MARLKNEHILPCRFCNASTVFVPVTEPCDYCKANNVTCEASECTRCDQLDAGECTRVEKRASSVICGGPPGGQSCGTWLWNEELVNGICIDCGSEVNTA